MYNLIIGSHVSFTKDKQLYGCVLEMLDYGANTFMFYTGAPQNTNRCEIYDERTNEAYELLKANNIELKNVIVHAPYIINLANKANHEFSIEFLRQEIDRCVSLGIEKIVLHPGSHVGVGIEEGIKNISDALNEVLKGKDNVKICLETMAGKGSEVGSKFEEIKKIIDNIHDKDKMMVCLDTCHISDAGYDVSDFDKVLEEFDRVIGLSLLGCIHINDSKNPMGSHKDRHENIGLGSIGFDNMMKIIYHSKLDGIPKILETPYVSKEDDSKDKLYPPYRFEIEMIKNIKMNPNLIEDIREYYR